MHTNNALNAPVFCYCFDIGIRAMHAQYDAVQALTVELKP